MDAKVQFTDQRICEPEAALPEGTGAVVEFRGVVRSVENGKRIFGLRYEIYEAMAERLVRRIVEELNSLSPCLAFLVIHRHGLVPAGETAVYVRIEARHRTEAIKMLEQFMNRLKSDVPIWKVGSVAC